MENTEQFTVKDYSIGDREPLIEALGIAHERALELLEQATFEYVNMQVGRQRASAVLAAMTKNTRNVNETVFVVTTIYKRVTT